MGYDALVKEEIEDGETLIREFGLNYPVKAAFWLRESDSDERYLCIASDAIDDGNFDLAYREIVDIERRHPFRWLDILKVKVLYGTNPLAVAAAELLNAYSARIPTKLREAYLGNRRVDELYLYAPSATTTHP